MSKNVNKLPSAFAVQRCLVVTDAAMFNYKENKKGSPILVVEHGLRGTQNVNTATGLNKEVSNVQVTETAKTDQDSTAMLVRFGIRTAPLSEAVVMCSESGSVGNVLGKNMRSAIEGFIAQAQSSDALQVLSERYARNILNGRWLWRNRSYAKSVTITVRKSNPTKDLVCTVDALSLSLTHFDQITAEEKALAEILAKGFACSTAVGLDIEALVDFGVEGAVEVYPSQNYNPEKQKGFARSLYKLRLSSDTSDLGSGFKVRGVAAIRDQKIGNALRTIDTWYQAYPEIKLITPVEPYAANLDVGEFLRTRKESAFELLKTIGETDPLSDNGQFLLSIMVRGGVFGEASEKKKEKDKAEESSESDSNE